MDRNNFMSFNPIRRDGLTPAMYDIYGTSLREGEGEPHTPHAGGKKHSILLVIASAIIFTTVIAVYELIRVGLNNHYHRKTNKKNKQENLAKENLRSAFMFAIICIISAVILVPILYHYAVQR